MSGFGGFGGFGGPSGAMAYSKVSVQSKVDISSPHGLILMLFDGALQAIDQGRLAIEKKDYTNKVLLLNKAIRIVDEGLRAAVDFNAGQEIAQNLYALYSYISATLLSASIHNDLEKLAECRMFLDDLRSAWHQIGGQVSKEESVDPLSPNSAAA